MRIRTLLLLAALLPFTASAAKIVPGFTEATVGERGIVSVSMTLMGPAKGPLKIGLANGKRLSRAVDLELTELGAGEFTSVMTDLRVGRTPTGSHTIGIAGPKGIIARTTVTIIPGPKQETLTGKKTKLVATYLQKRDGDLKLGWIDDTDEALIAVFFLKVKDTGDAYSVDFIHRKKRVCGDIIYPPGFKGQVVKVRATCRLGEAEEIEETDDIILDDDSHMYEPVPVSGGGSGDIDAGEEKVADAMTLEDVRAKGGLWKVEVRKGKKLMRTLNFSVKAKKIMAGLPGRAPLKPARVRVLSP